MIVVIVIACVLVAMLVVMKWADRRDRANGHRNRGMGDIRGTIREQRMNTRMLRRPGGQYAARSPHQVVRGDEHRR